MAWKARNDFINVAAMVRETKFLGPGLRAVLWVRGCFHHCKGCFSPEWQSVHQENYQSDQSLAERLLIQNPGVEGITFSGGDPFLQAESLAKMLRFARTERDFNVISYSGYTLEQLQKEVVPGANDLLAEIDILIDGKYVEALNTGVGMYGSTNQKVHYLTNNIERIDFASLPRKVEIRINSEEAFLVGVPGKKISTQFAPVVDDVIQQVGHRRLIHPITVVGD